MGLVIDDRDVVVPGAVVKSFRDDPTMCLQDDDFRLRQHDTWVHSIVMHTTIGDPPKLLSGAGQPGLAAKTVENWKTDKRHAGSHLIIDSDATIWCLIDLKRYASYHATTINEFSIGVELSQRHEDLGVFARQYEALVLLCDVLTWEFGIQRQFQKPYRKRAIPRLIAGGSDCVGIFGHRDQSDDRGFGDPGDDAFAYLGAARYLALDYEAKEDLTIGRLRQQMLNAKGASLLVDGVLGPTSVAARKERCGSPLWIERPGDVDRVA